MIGFVQNLDKIHWKLCFGLRLGNPYIGFIETGFTRSIVDSLGRLQVSPRKWWQFVVPVVAVVGNDCDDGVTPIISAAGCRSGGLFGTVDNRRVMIVECNHSFAKLLKLIWQSFIYKRSCCQPMLVGLV